MVIGLHLMGINLLHRPNQQVTLRDADIDKDILEDIDLAELWRTHTQDIY